MNGMYKVCNGECDSTLSTCLAPLNSAASGNPIGGTLLAMLIPLASFLGFPRKICIAALVRAFVRWPLFMFDDFVCIVLYGL